MPKLTIRWLAIGAAVALSFAVFACAGAPSEGVEGSGNSGAALDAGEHGPSEGGEEGEGEHGEEGGHGEGEEGEESGTYIARNEPWDRTRRGARLVLTFNASRNAFVGTVENTTEQTLCAVRVEVHLDGGTELGPTARTDVPSGGTIEVELPTEGEGFETWTAHPELSSCGWEAKDQAGLSITDQIGSPELRADRQW